MLVQIMTCALLNKMHMSRTVCFGVEGGRGGGGLVFQGLLQPHRVTSGQADVCVLGCGGWEGGVGEGGRGVGREGKTHSFDCH